jgi:hypothetical protein
VLKDLLIDKVGDREFQLWVERCKDTACAYCSYAMWSRTALEGELHGSALPSTGAADFQSRIWLYLYCQVSNSDLFPDRIYDCDVQRYDAAKRRRRQRASSKK